MNLNFAESIRRNPILYKCFAVLLLVVMLFSMTPTPAHAADNTVHIQCSINLDSWQVLTAVVQDQLGLTQHSPEVRRVDSGTLEKMAKGSSSMSAGIEALAGLSDDRLQERNGKVNGVALGGLVGAGEKNRVLTFPSDSALFKDDSTSADYNKALEVNNKISFSLNQAFSLYLDEKKITPTPDPVKFRDAMVGFLRDVSGKASSGDTVTLTYAGVTQEYQWRADKGDGKYVNWAMLAFEAFNNYSLEGDEAVTEMNVYSGTPSQMEKAVTSVLGSALDGLRSAMGLWTLDELFFNQGFRENGYVGGIFPKSWEPTIWALFIVMEVLAALVLLVGVINNIFKKALSTTNFFMRMDAMRQVQDVIVCAIALSLLPLILRIIISMSANFSDMVFAIIDEGENTKTVSNMVARYGAGSGTISGVIMQFMFFGVQVYFNFFYALRALMVAILIMIAPAMVAMIAVSDRQKQVMLTWAKELLANILIQPIHAFIMVVILILPSSSHAFDNLIALYAMIPLTTVIKGMFFGPAGGWAEQVAQRARGKLTGAMAGAAGGLAAGGIATAAAAVKGGVNIIGSSGSGGRGSEGSSEGESGGSGDATFGRPQTGSSVGETGESTATETTPKTGISAMRQRIANTAPGKTVASAMGRVADTSAGKTLSSAAGRVANSAAVKTGSQLAGTAVKSAPRYAAAIAAGTAAGAMQGAGLGSPLSASLVNASRQPFMKKDKKQQGENSSQKQTQDSKYQNTDSESLTKNKPPQTVTETPDARTENWDNSVSPRESDVTDEFGVVEDNDDAVNPDIPSVNMAKAVSRPDANANGALALDANGGLYWVGKVNGQTSGKRGQLVDRYEMNKDEMQNNGITNLRDDWRGPDKGTLSFDMNQTNTPMFKEMKAYADFSKGLSSEERSALQDKTGVSVTKGRNGAYRVTIDKQKWSAANNGASIEAISRRTNEGKRESTGLAIESSSETAPSLFGATDAYSCSSIHLPEACIVRPAAPSGNEESGAGSANVTDGSPSTQGITYNVKREDLNEQSMAVLRTEAARYKSADEAGQQYVPRLSNVQSIKELDNGTVQVVTDPKSHGKVTSKQGTYSDRMQNNAVVNQFQRQKGVASLGSSGEGAGQVPKTKGPNGEGSPPSSEDVTDLFSTDS